MANFANTFTGKLYLLLIDKVAIGAILALAFFAYDRWKTIETRQYQEPQDEAAQIRDDRLAAVQLDFERSRLIKEFLPVIQDNGIDLVTRGYVLRSAVITGALDADAAFELGQDFLRAGLTSNHYRCIVEATLPRVRTHNQNITVAAKAQAERNRIGHLS